MLKVSRLVPAGTSESVNAGGLDEQRATPVHEKLSDIAIASEHATSTATIVARAAMTVTTWRGDTLSMNLPLLILRSPAY
jgi:hypothetical protein